MPADKTGPDAIEKRRRMALALEYREKGYKYRDIAERLGVSTSTAYDYVRDAIKEITREPAEAVLTLELDRLDNILRAVLPLAIDGDLDYVDRYIKLTHQRARLIGLYHLAEQQIKGSGREMAAVDAFFAGILGSKAGDEDDPK